MSRPTVIVAEDYVLLQEMIRYLLEPECDVLANVENGFDAVEAVARHRPDVLLVDVSLPGANGFTVAKTVRTSYPEVKVLFITAHRDQAYVDRAFELGASGYVLKGSMRTELLPAIRQVLGGGVYRSAALA